MGLQISNLAFCLSPPISMCILHLHKSIQYVQYIQYVRMLPFTFRIPAPTDQKQYKNFVHLYKESLHLKLFSLEFAVQSPYL